MKKRLKIMTSISATLVGFICIVMLVFFVRFMVLKNTPINYQITQIDLSERASFISKEKFSNLFDYAIVDNQGDYLAHPDSIIINDKIVTVYVNGHGKGEVLTKISQNGINYSNRLTSTPKSWKNSKETPTLFSLDFQNGMTRYILVSANPKWPDEKTGDGFQVSMSRIDNQDDFSTWSEFQKFYGIDDPIMHVSPIVAMSSLVHLKENGKFVDKWMGFFHDHQFKNYKTILSFDDNGNMAWSKPQEYFKSATEDYFNIAKKTQMCETLVFRNDNNQGDVLCLISRSNTKKTNSLVSFSYDEGDTWSKPKEIFDALNGERHKLIYLPDGRIAITFRSIELDSVKIAHYADCMFASFYSEGWLMWVGTWEDIYRWYNGTSKSQGQYRIKIAHTYLNGQTKPEVSANADTGYCGNVLLKDGTIVTTSYGIFSTNEVTNGGLRTFIASKKFKIAEIDEIYEQYLEHIQTKKSVWEKCKLLFYKCYKMTIEKANGNFAFKLHRSVGLIKKFCIR